MQAPTIDFPKDGLAVLGLDLLNVIHYQLTPNELIRDTLRIGDGILSNTGALVINTGKFTGRSPKDKYIVRDGLTACSVNWNEFNIPIEENNFHLIFHKIKDYLNKLPELWVRDCYACADPRYRLNIRVISEKPWMDLFAFNMFLRPGEDELNESEPDWQILSVPGLKLDPEVCGIRQSNAAVISFTHKMVLIAGTGYTGETKKGIFTILNYLLPQTRGVLSMHCSANVGQQGDTALFFGLSGTGKLH